jgi:hypothetical protein
MRQMIESGSEKMLNLTDCVEAYEQSIADGSDCAIESFAPQLSHPEYSQIVVELVRVEMEHKGWSHRSSVAEYSERFPGVFADTSALAIIAFEEFRVRRQHGEAITRQEYAEKFRIDTTQWPSVASNPEIVVMTAGECELSTAKAADSFGCRYGFGATSPVHC